MRANTLDAKQLEIDGQAASGGSNPNLFINGQFDIWQRGTSISGPISLTYSCADRWIFYDGSNGTANVSRQTFTIGQTDVPANPKYYVQYDMTVQATTGGPGIHQRIEYVTTVQGGPITLSFYAKLASGTLDITPYVNQYFGSTGSAAAGVDYTSQVITLTSTWTKHIVTLDVPSISGKTVSGGDDFLQVGFKIPLSSGTFTMSLANMKAEKGSIATPFVQRTIQEELLLCQRYYETSVGHDEILGSGSIGCNCMLHQVSANLTRLTGNGSSSFEVEKRVDPSVTIYDRDGNSGQFNLYNSAATSIGVSALAGPSRIVPFHYLTASSNVTDGAYYQCNWAADAEL